VSTARECAWSAQASAGWIRLIAASGQGEGAIRFSVDENNSQSSRGGTIRLSDGQQISVHQEAEPPPSPRPPPPAPAPSPGPSPTPAPAPPPTLPVPPSNPDQGQTVEFDGRVFGVHGQCPDLRFSVSGREVRTNGRTDFKKLNCRDIRNWMQVKVKGVVQTDGSVLASRVEEQDD
jgi:hypothetical protein